MTYSANLGRCPREAEIRAEDGGMAGYRKVHVILHNGHDTKGRGQDPWPAAQPYGSRSPSTVWRISQPPHDFEIKKWEII